MSFEYNISVKKILNIKIFFIGISAVIIAIILSYFCGAYYAYFYPMKYEKEIVLLADKYGVSGGLIASIANVESNFNSNAVSNRGAVGVMQLMPSTARWIAEKNGIEFSSEKLKEADYNLNLGSYYLAFLIDYFEDERLGICAYNAGQGNVTSWLADDKYSADGKSLTKIPFEETRIYLQKVLHNYNYYKNKYK